MVISAREFNSQDSDISKVLYLIEKLISVKIYGDANDIISKIISSLSFTFNFNYSPENVKADLMLRDSLIYEDRITKKVVRIAQKGGLMEIKYKPFKVPSYLSEFFKIDASNVNYSLIIEGLSKIPKITDVKTAFKVFMSSLIGNLKKTMVTTDGEKIIEHLTNNLSGIIFKDNINDNRIIELLNPIHANFPGVKARYDSFKEEIKQLSKQSKYFTMFGGSYNNKYMKYKSKYLKLKQLLR